jgi:hypothetical protein
MLTALMSSLSVDVSLHAMLAVCSIAAIMHWRICSLRMSSLQMILFAQQSSAVDVLRASLLGPSKLRQQYYCAMLARWLAPAVLAALPFDARNVLWALRASYAGSGWAPNWLRANSGGHC